jgi:hypothetical protein
VNRSSATQGENAPQYFRSKPARSEGERPARHCGRRLAWSERDGKRSVEGFAFAPDRITGLKELAENTPDGKVLVKTLMD